MKAQFLYEVKLFLIVTLCSEKTNTSIFRIFFFQVFILDATAYSVIKIYKLEKCITIVWSD
jgi:hypothetical protein